MTHAGMVALSPKAPTPNMGSIPQSLLTLDSETVYHIPCGRINIPLLFSHPAPYSKPLLG